MPVQERPLSVDGRYLGGNHPSGHRQHREAMARNTSPQGSDPRADVQPSPLDEADWDQEHDEAAGYRARRLLSRSDSGFHRLGDRVGALSRWLAGERWVKRLAIAIAALMVIFAASFGALWWRLGAGPINLEMATPWLAAAIEEISATAIRSKSEAPRSSGRAGFASPCASAISLSGIATMPSWRAPRRPR